PVRSLRDKRVCFTGPLGKATRAEARFEVERLGGIYQGQVGPKTDVLVRGRPSPAWMHGTHGKKLAKATAYGTRVIKESQFWRLLPARRRARFVGRRSR